MTVDFPDTWRFYLLSKDLINSDNTYKVVMFMQMSHRFCNIHTPDDDNWLGRKYMGNNDPAGYYKITSATGKDTTCLLCSVKYALMSLERL